MKKPLLRPLVSRMLSWLHSLILLLPGLRYRLNHPLLGKLKKLAKARFELGALVALDQTLWRPTVQDMELLVQSVVASSAIEGEAISAEEVPLVLEAVT